MGCVMDGVGRAAVERGADERLERRRLGDLSDELYNGWVGYPQECTLMVT